MIRTATTALCTFFLSTGITFGWTLDGDASSISYVSMKNAETAEANLLPGLSGTVDDDGKARIEIDLTSVETYVDIRNERMREYVFSEPIAVLTADLDMAGLSSMEEGITQDIEFEVNIEVNGNSSSYDVIAAATRVGADRVVVSARQPVIIYPDDLGYGEGIAKLQELAGLDSIQLTVPVTFTLAFDR